MNSLRSRIEALIFQPPPFDPDVNSARARDIGIDYIPIYFPLAGEGDGPAQADTAAGQAMPVYGADATLPPRDKSFLSYIYRVLGNGQTEIEGGEGVDHSDIDHVHTSDVSPGSSSSAKSSASAAPPTALATPKAAPTAAKGGWLKYLWGNKEKGVKASVATSSASPAMSPSYRPGATPSSVVSTPMSTGSSRRQRFRAYKASQEGTPMSSDGGGRSSGGYLGLGGGATPLSTPSAADDALPWALSKRSSVVSLGGSLSTPTKPFVNATPPREDSLQGISTARSSMEDTNREGGADATQTRQSSDNDVVAISAPPPPQSSSSATLTFESSGAGSTRAGVRAPSGTRLHSRQAPTGKISFIFVRCALGAQLLSGTPTHPPSAPIPFEGTESANPLPCAKFTILFCHGNADDLPSSYFYYKRLANELQCDVVAWDYLGYGFSSGDKSDAKADCTEKNAFRGVQAVYDHMVTTMGIDPQSIIIMGRSVGSGAAVELALRLHKLQFDGERVVTLRGTETKVAPRRPFAGLIVYSGLLSAASCAIKEFLAPFVPGDIMVNRKKMDKITHVPILIIHGSNDDVVPFSHGQQLYELAMKRNTVGVSMLEMDGCGHNDVEFRSAKKFFGALRRFVDDL